MAESSLRAVATDPPRRRVRLQLISVVTIVVTAGYLVWRVNATLNPDAPLLSWVFWGLEVYGAVGLLLFVHATWDLDTVPAAPRVTTTTRRVAVLIATYNEDADTLLPTVAAAVALQPAHETWVLDDGRRPWVQEMAVRLGARYLTRPDNSHAKAGNLNHALGVIDADLVAVLDADHVPAPGLLTDTIGYFDRHDDLAVVQTPQDFYNTDSFEHTDDGFAEEALFYRVIQPGKNRVNAAFWCGTSAVLRTEALRSVGGVATESVTEDIHTSMRLHRAGWRTVFHDDVLARGVAPSTYEGFRTQRSRWGSGAMTVLRTEHPWFVRGLTPSQRLAYTFSLGGWFESWRTLGYLLLPVAVLLTGWFPIAADPVTFVAAFAAVTVLQQLTFALLARGHSHPWHSLVFDVIRLPANLGATLALVVPGSGRFAVTPKGRTGSRRRTSAVPPLLAALLVGQALALVWFVATLAGATIVEYSTRGVAGFTALIMGFQAVIVSAAVRRIRDPRFASERRSGHRVDTTLPVRVNGVRCEMASLSTSGALVRPLEPGIEALHDPMFVEFPAGVDGPPVQVRPVRVNWRRDSHQLAVTFVEGQWIERAHLARLMMWAPERLRPATPPPEVGRVAQPPVEAAEPAANPWSVPISAGRP